MKRILIFLALITLGQKALGQKTTKPELSSTEVNPLQELDIFGPVSIINLIATPEKYHGKKIQIIGYLHLEFEGNAIYLHKEDYTNGISENALWVNFSEKLTKNKNIKDYSDHYVIILGTFNKNINGHMGLFNGAMEDLIRLDYWR